MAMTYLLSPREVAHLVGVSPRTVRRWAARGQLEAVRLPSGRWRIPEEAVPRRNLDRKGRGGASA